MTLPISPFPWCPAQRGLDSPLHGLEDTATHQVHDEVQLDGEVHDEEDTGPGVPGVGGHHHVWETALAEDYPQGPVAACLHLL